MKHMKIIGLLVLAAALLMAFTNSASAAPVLTSPAGTEYTGEVDATLKVGTTLSISAGISQTCTTATTRGNLTINNGHARWTNSTTTYGTAATPCTKTMKVIKNGADTVGDKGEVISSEDELTIFDIGVSCIYGGATGTNMGTLTGGSPAVIDVSTTEWPKISGGFLCSSKATVTGTWVVTTPSQTFIT